MVPRRRTIGRLLHVRIDGSPGYDGLVHVREDGPADAPPMLLLHGFCGSMHWLDLMVPRLTDRFRVIRVDLLGHGSTTGPAADAPLQAQVLRALLERLGYDDLVVAGHSFGADVAIELAETSDRVERVAIVTQAPDYSDAMLPRARWLMAVPGLVHTLGRVGQVLAALVGVARVLRRSPEGSSELARQGLLDFRALRLGMFRIVLVERRDRMARRPLDQQVRTGGKPTLVVLGGRDHFYGVRSAPRYRAAGADVRILPDSGHSPMVEFPDEVAKLLREFAR